MNILIVSNRQCDLVNQIMQWLIQSEIDVLRINQEDQIEKFLIKLGEDDIFYCS